MLYRLHENDTKKKQQCGDQINEQVLMKTYDGGFLQKPQHMITRKTKLTSKKKKHYFSDYLMSDNKNSCWNLKGEKKDGDNGRKRKAAHDTTFEYFHHSRLADDRKGKAAYDTSDVTSTEVAATSYMSTPTPVELCYDSYWTDRYFLI
jgi:hypothetical protein